MKLDRSDLNKYYQNYEEDNRLVKDNAHRMEFLTTCHYLKKIIKKSMKILDIGAGTGRYTMYCASLHAKVTAFEISDANINIMKEKSNHL